MWSGFLSGYQGAGPSMISKLLASEIKSPCPGSVLTPPQAVPLKSLGFVQERDREAPSSPSGEKALISSSAPTCFRCCEAGGREMELEQGEGHVQAQEAWRLRTQL